MNNFLKRRIELDKIKTLRKSIFDEEDLILFDEAIRCFANQAYRASFIIIWLCVAESLRSKFAIMSHHDSDIGKILRKILELESQDRSTDSFILKNAVDIGLISQDEFTRLDHIREMRNIYAHPMGINPAREEVVASFVLIVEIVLKRPSLLRHGYVDRLIKSLFEDPHFLPDDISRIKEYTISVVDRIHYEVFPFVFRKLLERIEKIIDDPSSRIFIDRGLEFGKVFLQKVKPDLTLSEWNIISTIQRFPKSSSLLISIPTTWPSLQEQAKNMVFGYLVEPLLEGKIQNPTATGLKKARILLSKGMVTKQQEEKLNKVLEKTPYPTLRLADVPLKEYSRRIIDDLKSHNWYVQNPAAKTLRQTGISECSQVASATQEQLGRNILQSAQGETTEAEEFISSILNKKEVWPRFFVKGLLAETLVNDSHEFRLKKRRFEDVIKIVLFHPEVKEIIEDIIREIESSKKSMSCKIEDYNTATDIIKKVMSKESVEKQDILSVLTKAIDAVKEKSESEIPF